MWDSRIMLSRTFILVFLSFTLSACQSAYYGAMEKVGYHKRDIMIDRIESVQDSQSDAKEQFASALDQYRALVKVEDQDLVDQYEKLNDEFEDSKSAAETVSNRIAAVESVSEALFEEWNEELSLYSDPKLKQQSAVKLKDTKQKYKYLIQSMKKAEASMQPVLATMQDQVLYLKHNLNAQAIDSLKGELVSIESNVAQLIDQMEKSIAESQAFVTDLKQSR